MSPSLRHEEVAALVAELAPVLIGARLDKVFDRPPHGFLLRFKAPEGKRNVLVSTRPGLARLHLVDEPGESPESLSDEASALRALLGGARVVAVDQPGADRLMRIRFASGPAESVRTIDLVLELFGGSGRLLVIDETSRRVRFRHGRGGIETGERYRFPDPPPRPAAPGFSIPFEPRALLPAELHGREAPFHRFIELRLSGEEARRDREERREGILVRLRRETKRRRSLAEKLAEERAEAAKWERWQRWGELLKGALPELRRGLAAATVTDWFEPGAPPTEIPLDPVLTPLENVERCFRRARKGKRALASLDERLAALAAELADAEERRAAVESAAAEDPASETAAFERAFAWLASAERARPERAPAAPRKGEGGAPAKRGPRRYRTREGLEVLAGRNARENEELSIRLAHGNDLFFHRADRPGPHVIVRVPKGKSAAPESIDDAAYIAAYLSGWRGPDHALVVWTEAKHVRKPKGLPLGKVLVHRTREHRVEFREGRIGALAAAEGESAGPP